MPTLHVVIPCYDEPDTLEPCVARVRSATLPDGWSMRLTLVDDHSKPDTASVARALAERHASGDRAITLHRHEVNRGKGAALRTGFAIVLESAADEDLVLIQDADLEYDPDDYATLVETIDATNADAVFGDRWHARPGSDPIRFVHRAGNRTLTELSNLATGLTVRDMECCYKLLRVPVLRAILDDLDEDRFGIEPQIAAALARRGLRVVNAPVDYRPRGFDEGKKIGVSDLVRALVVISREGFTSAWRGASTS